MEPCTTEEIEEAALDYLSGNQDMISDHWGPIAYNMVANDGRGFIAPGVESGDQTQLIHAIHALEVRARQWQDGEQRKAHRAEQTARAYNDQGQLPVLTKEQIEQKRIEAGADRIIIAEYCVDESDIQTDYFGGRTARRVVIGFGKGKRENFRQLRTAAGAFPPTAHMGPGKDIFRPRVVVGDDITSNGRAYWKGTHSHWHQDLEQDAVLPTRAEAEAFIAQQGEPHQINFDGKAGNFRWHIEGESYEQRENYSMGGGNYLGTNRYGGWKVSSTTRLWDDRMEYWTGKK
jgi:hypothetical protein